MIPLPTLCDIYRFEFRDNIYCAIPAFPRQSAFWGLIASGHFDSGTATQTYICHPTMHYFIKVLANTLLCKMEPNKVRVQELTLLFKSVRDLVEIGYL